MNVYDPSFVSTGTYEIAYPCCGGNGLVYVRAGAKKHIWQVRLNVRKLRGYVVRSTGTGDLPAALAFAEDLYYDLKRRLKEGLAIQAPDFTSFVNDEWLPYAKEHLSGHRHRLHAGTIKRYLIPYFGKERLDDIRQKKIDDYWEWRRDYWITGLGKDQDVANAAKNPTYKSLTMERSILNQIFRYSKRKEYIIALPLLDVPKSRRDAPSKVRPYFSPDEYDLLEAFMLKWQEGGLHSLHKVQRRMLRLFILFLFNTGMRPKEALSIKWHMIFDPRYETTRRKRLSIFIPPDTKTGDRDTVPLEGTDKLLDEVKSISKFTGENDFVFADQHGKAMNQSHKTFEKMLKEAGLLKDRKNKNRTYYSCRHSHISFKLLNDVPAEVIARNCGTSAKEIRKHYDHVTPIMQEEIHATNRSPSEVLGRKWGETRIEPVSAEEMDRMYGVKDPDIVISNIRPVRR